MKKSQKITKTTTFLLMSLSLVALFNTFPARTAHANDFPSNLTIIWNSGTTRINPYPDVPPPHVVVIPPRIVRYVAPAPVYHPGYTYLIRTQQDWDNAPHNIKHHKRHVDNRKNHNHH